LPLLSQRTGETVPSPPFYRLGQAAEPGQTVNLQLAFSSSGIVDPQDGEMLLGGWYPRLWWDGQPSASSYRVTFNIPDGYTAAASGRYNPQTTCWEVDGAKNFGIYLGKNLRVKETDIGGVNLRVLYPEGDDRVAQVVFAEAQNVIPFYQRYAGFYPYPFLNIIPGGSGPWGGYPFNPGIVVVHGMQVFDEAPLDHWKWITAHEIGHEYWGEHVLDGDTPDWTWIALGIYMDREYWMAQGHDASQHTGLMSSYHQALEKGYDTTIDMSLTNYDMLPFSHNTYIQHGKAVVAISALDWVLGKEVFKRVVLRGLHEFKWKRFRFQDLWRLCEEERGEDLGWFFDPWMRSDAVLSYRAENIRNEQRGSDFVCTATLRRVGDLKMPLPVRFVFEDGSTRDFRTNRIQDRQELEVSSRSKLKEVLIDPDNLLAMLPKLPPRTLNRLSRDIRKVWNQGDATTDLELYEDAKRLKLSDGKLLLRLGMLLYGGSRYAESIDLFKIREALAEGEEDRFLNNAWLGLLHDLIGKRDEAKRFYSISLEHSEQQAMRHDQYRLLLNRAWLLERLNKPYTRP